MMDITDYQEIILGFGSRLGNNLLVWYTSNKAIFH